MAEAPSPLLQLSPDVQTALACPSWCEEPAGHYIERDTEIVREHRVVVGRVRDVPALLVGVEQLALVDLSTGVIAVDDAATFVRTPRQPFGAPTKSTANLPDLMAQAAAVLTDGDLR